MLPDSQEVDNGDDDGGHPYTYCEASSRRRTFVGGMASAAAAGVASGIAAVGGGAQVLPPAEAAVKGAKGAAEYDLEFYLRDLVKGNTKEGNLPVSAQPPAPPPRALTGLLLPILLDEECSSSCVPARVLAAVSGKSAKVVSEKMEDYRSKSAKAFAAKAQWAEERVSDQYYFDLTSYALWRTAADLIPDFVKRDKFARDVGREIYAGARKAGLLKKPALMVKGNSADSSDDSSDDKGASSDDSKDDSSDDSSDDALLGPLTGTIPAVLEILNVFNSTGFCSSFQLGGEDASRRGRFVFDDLDDDDLTSGASVDCLVSIYQPAVLGASLQITGEGSRFSPDFVGATLAAMWEEAGIKARFESYFVDPTYRANPKDYFPDEQLLQFTLSKK